MLFRSSSVILQILTAKSFQMIGSCSRNLGCDQMREINFRKFLFSILQVYNGKHTFFQFKMTFVSGIPYSTDNPLALQTLVFNYQLPYSQEVSLWQNFLQNNLKSQWKMLLIFTQKSQNPPILIKYLHQLQTYPFSQKQDGILELCLRNKIRSMPYSTFLIKEIGIFSKQSSFFGHLFLQFNNFIAFYNNNKMKSPYYKSTSKGYVLTYRNIPTTSDTSKQLPVYRVVNQFMNLPQEEEDQFQDHPQNQKIQVNATKSQTQQNEYIQNDVKYLTRNPSRVMEKDQVKSIYTLEEKKYQTPLTQEWHQSMKNYQIGKSQSGYLGKNAGSQVQTKTQAITGIEPSNNQRVLEFELEKEKILRKNLEKSYQNLLRDLQQREMVLSFKQHQNTKNENKEYQYSFTDRLYYGSPKNSKEVNIKTEKKEKKNKKDEKESTRKRRRTCGHFHEDGSDELSETESIQSEKHGHQEEKQFKLKMRQDMQKLEKRIEELNYQLLKKEKLFQENEEKARMAELEKQFLKKKLSNEKMMAENEKVKEQPKANETGLSMKQHMHYIFTIFMMFLCLAMVLKKF